MKVKSFKIQVEIKKLLLFGFGMALGNLVRPLVFLLLGNSVVTNKGGTIPPAYCRGHERTRTKVQHLIEHPNLEAVETKGGSRSIGRQAVGEMYRVGHNKLAQNAEVPV